MTSHTPFPTPRLALFAASVAVAFAFVGGLIVTSTGGTLEGRVMATLVGFLVLGAGAVMVLALVAPGRRLAARGPTRRGR